MSRGTIIFNRKPKPPKPIESASNDWHNTIVDITPQDHKCNEFCRGRTHMSTKKLIKNIEYLIIKYHGDVSVENRFFRYFVKEFVQIPYNERYLFLREFEYHLHEIEYCYGYPYDVLPYYDLFQMENKWLLKWWYVRKYHQYEWLKFRNSKGAIQYSNMLDISYHIRNEVSIDQCVKIINDYQNKINDTDFKIQTQW